MQSNSASRNKPLLKVKSRINKPSKFDSMSHAQVWEAFSNGNNGAFLYIYNTYFDTLYSFGFQFSEDKDFIKDCIQDLFVELNQNKKKLKVKSVKSYLMVCLKRKIIYYQKRASKFVYKHDLLQGYDFQMSFSYEERLINRQFEEEKKKKLNHSINKTLTPRQREAIYYLYYEKLPVDEIAQIMGVSKRGVQNIIYKAVSILKSQLAIFILLLLDLASAA